MAFIRSILFSLSFYAGTVVAVLLGFPAAAIGPRYLIAVTHGWSRWHRWSAATFLGIRTRIEGEPPRGAVIVACKHESMFETIEILLWLDQPAVVMKKELTDTPGWGWVARRYGVIPVDRAGGAVALRRMLRAAEAAIAEGRPIAIFPEGTRVNHGESPPLQPGFAGLYRALKLPVVPVAVDSGRLWPRGRFVKHRGTVHVRFGKQVPPSLPRGEIQARVHAAINELNAPGDGLPGAG